MVSPLSDAGKPQPHCSEDTIVVEFISRKSGGQAESLNLTRRQFGSSETKRNRQTHERTGSELDQTFDGALYGSLGLPPRTCLAVSLLFYI